MGSSPNWSYAFVPSPAQWNLWFASKQDDLGYVPLNTAGGVMTGPLTLLPSTDLAAGLNVGEGIAPGSPVDGDVWITDTGLYYQANGTTYGPATGSVTSVGLTAPSQFSVSGSPVTGSGTLAISWANQTAHYVLAGPSSGGAAAPTFRALAAADLSFMSSYGATWVGLADVSAALSNLGLAPTNSPTFTSIELGGAGVTDTTLARASAGNISVEGNLVYRAGGTDVPITDGGTGASSASAALTNLGIGAGNTPTFTGIEFGGAGVTDTTLTRSTPGDLQIETNVIYRQNGTVVAIGDGGTGANTVPTALDNLGLGTSNTPQFLGVSVGSSDTTLTRLSAGNLAVGGNYVYRAGGTDVPITDGGTGASSASAARSNLGLGTSAVVDTGTSGSVIPLLSGTNTWSGNQALNSGMSIGTFSATGASRGIAIDGNGNYQFSADGTGTFSAQRFYNPNLQVGSINTTGSNTQFNTTSDENLKTFLEFYSPEKAFALILSDPVWLFSWNHSKEVAVGWGAQTSYAKSKDLATPGGWKDPKTGEPWEEGSARWVDEFGESCTPDLPGARQISAVYEPWGMDFGKRAPYLWAGLTGAILKIQELEKRISELEEKK